MGNARPEDGLGDGFSGAFCRVMVASFALLELAQEAPKELEGLDIVRLPSKAAVLQRNGAAVALKPLRIVVKRIVIPVG